MEDLKFRAVHRPILNAMPGLTYVNTFFFEHEATGWLLPFMWSAAVAEICTLEERREWISSKFLGAITTFE
jgi:hypothetical protein